MDERLSAVNGLVAVFTKNAFSNKYIDEVVKKEAPDRRARSFFTRLFLGTIEKASLLDAIIDRVASVKCDRQRPVILQILRISVYQLYFMNSVPERAVVDSAVKLCVKKKCGPLKGFVNGVLRNVARGKQELMEEVIHAAGANAEALRLSIPTPVYNYLKEDFGGETVNKIFGDRPTVEGVSLRVNEEKISPEEAVKLLEESKLYADLINGLPMIRVRGFENIESIPHFKDGYFYVQDESSVRAVLACEIKPGWKVMDVCSAPGGKGIFAAQLTGPKGSVVMRDLSAGKVDIIKENLERMGTKNAKVLVWDALKPDKTMNATMDLVIADLPCAGLGTMHKKPEIRYRTDMAKIRELSDLQGRILSVVKDYVKPGGRLMFSTCSLGHLENEDNVDRFISENPDFVPVKKEIILPTEDGSDGFFYCVMEKKNG